MTKSGTSARRKRNSSGRKDPSKFPLEVLARFACLDCNINVVTSGDWYLAKPEIWEDELGLGWTDNLCVACLESRLGREVRPMLDILPTRRCWGSHAELGTSPRLREIWRPFIEAAQKAMERGKERARLRRNKLARQRRAANKRRDEDGAAPSHWPNSKRSSMQRKAT